MNIIKNKIILITGGTGSIGSALAIKMLKLNCKVVRVMSNDENGLYDLSNSINSFTKTNTNFFDNMEKNKVRFFLGDVRDYERCLDVTRGVDIVIHAAALKHVSICEYNPFEVIKTNVIGTQNLIKASLLNKVKKFLFISTDKVVLPESTMGSSKLQAEKIVIDSNEIKGKNKTVFSCVRFGNVLGTRGSVVPNFINKLRQKKNIFVTDKKMARFMMTIDNAIDLIIQCLKDMRGSEIFILKSMKSFKVIDLANSLLNYFKKKGNNKSKIIISQKYAGEKLQEDLFSNAEIPYIREKSNVLVIVKNRKNNNKNYNSILQYKTSNFNFLKSYEIINLIKKNNLLN